MTHRLVDEPMGKNRLKSQLDAAIADLGRATTSSGGATRRGITATDPIILEGSRPSNTGTPRSSPS
ncbi:MAG: hypothetical protein WKF75_00290 [Singulisphaera sp.]